MISAALPGLLGLKSQIPNYYHLPLITGSDGRRLAKRHGDTRIAYYRDRGVPASRVLTLLKSWSGMNDSNFDLSKLPPQPIVFTDEDNRFLLGK